MEPPKLIKIRIVVETDVVAENFFGTDIKKCAREVWEENWQDIVLEADNLGEIKIDVQPVLSKKELPKGWTVNHRPFQPNKKYAKREDLKSKIGTLLKKVK